MRDLLLGALLGLLLATAIMPPHPPPRPPCWTDLECEELYGRDEAAPHRMALADI